MLDDDREPLPIEVGHGTFGTSPVEAFDAAPQPVVVGLGESAVTGLLWRNTPTRSNGDPVTIDLGSTGKLGTATP